MSTIDKARQRYVHTLSHNWWEWCDALDGLTECDKLALRNDIRAMLGIDDMQMSGIQWQGKQRAVIALFCS